MPIIKRKDNIVIMLSVKCLINIIKKINIHTNSCFKSVSSKTDIFKPFFALSIQLSNFNTKQLFIFINFLVIFLSGQTSSPYL